MSMRQDLAIDALKALLGELPYEFTLPPGSVNTREGFKVIKRNNVRTIHEALWELQLYFGLQEDK